MPFAPKYGSIKVTNTPYKPKDPTANNQDSGKPSMNNLKNKDAADKIKKKLNLKKGGSVKRKKKK